MTDTTTKPTDIGELIKRERDARGIRSHGELARLLVKLGAPSTTKPQTIQAIEAGGVRWPRHQLANAIAAWLGMTLEELFEAAGQSSGPTTGSITAPVAREIDEILSADGDPDGTGDTDPRQPQSTVRDVSDDPFSNLVMIPLDVGDHHSAGHGVTEGQQMKLYRAFDRKALERQGLDWRTCRMAMVIGKSMEGGMEPLCHKDFIVYTTALREPRATDPAAYSIKLGDDSMVKTLIRTPGTNEITIRSENPDKEKYPDLFRKLGDPDFIVRGLVVHQSRWRRIVW